MSDRVIAAVCTERPYLPRDHEDQAACVRALFGGARRHNPDCDFLLVACSDTGTWQPDLLRDSGVIVEPRLHLRDCTPKGKYWLFDALRLHPEWRHAVYLDTDCVVRAPFPELFTARTLAARPNWPPRHTVGSQFEEWAGLPEQVAALPAFNSGVMAFPTGVLDSRHCCEWLCLVDDQWGHVVRPRYWDQPILNLVFREQWRALPPRYNARPRRAALEAQVILHGCADAKPWRDDSPLRPEWDENLRAFEDLFPVGVGDGTDAPD